MDAAPFQLEITTDAPAAFHAPTCSGSLDLRLGDCMEGMKTFPDGYFDLAVVDPPYGIGIVSQFKKTTESKRSMMRGMNGITGSEWDSATPDGQYFAELRRVSKHQIIWGGNYFRLPPSPCWLVWDKETAGVTTFADCELAWTNLTSAVRLKRYLWSGPYMRVKEDRVHPTQKPLPVMEWCAERVPKAQTNLDPFMGSGTTGVACANLGREFIGIEREPKYFDIACRRIEDAQRQGRLIA